MNEDFQEYMIQANALMGQEKYEDAIKYFEKAEQIDNRYIHKYFPLKYFLSKYLHYCIYLL